MNNDEGLGEAMELSAMRDDIKAIRAELAADMREAYLDWGLRNRKEGVMINKMDIPMDAALGDKSISRRLLQEQDTIESLRAELAAEQAKVADLTARLAAKESVEPVELPSELAVLNHPYGYPQETEETIKTQEQYASGWNAAISEVKKLGALYTTPPTTAAAVAAFRRKAANYVHRSNVGDSPYDEQIAKGIEALPADDSALREVCFEVAKKARYCGAPENIEAIVDEVLGAKE